MIVSQVSLRSQKRLCDKTASGRIIAWHVFKQFTQFLSDAYGYLEWKGKAERTGKCASYLAFLQCPESPNHPKKLIAARFCEDRLCPQCQKRRSIKQFAVAVKIGHALQIRQPTYRFIFLTLTVPNVKLDDLSDSITHIFKSWDRLIKRTEVKKAIKGYMRVLEVSYNHLRDDYHPHLHATLVVPSRYFTGDIYIKRDRWLQLWREATGMPEITQVDIRTIKPKKDGKTNSRKSTQQKLDALLAVFAEMSKYCLKMWSIEVLKSKIKRLEEGKEKLTRDLEGHIWLRGTNQETAVVVEKLHNALYKRRLVQYGGILREIKRELKLKDGEDKGADLVNAQEESTGCNCSICGGDMKEVWYLWNRALGNYYLKE